MNFTTALIFIKQVEGGFVNNPADSGGPTNYGITQATLSTYRRSQVTEEDVKELTFNEASQIYREFYWNALGLDLVPSFKVRLVLFDQGVNRGVPACVKILQRVLNESFHGNLVVDGIMGLETLKIIKESDSEKLARKLIQAFQKAYVQACTRNVSQLVFLEGWLNRTFELQDFIAYER